MQSTFSILISEAQKDSWPDVIWTDAKKDGADIYLDFCKHITKKLRILRKMHFSNSANKKVWFPMKKLWDWSNVLRPEQLDPSNRNYIIFQTGIKYSAHYIKKLKEERNACIILYMPDNIRTIGIAQTKAEFDRYCRHYHIDQLYSFDLNDCHEFGMEFFDYYSQLPIKIVSNKTHSDKLKVLYVGSCRSKERLDTLHKLYDSLNEKAECTFYLNGVNGEDATRENINYNHPLTYLQVVNLVQQHDIIIEIMNGQQAGNTLRFKEAVCYNKLLLTNNHSIKNSQYYNQKFIQIFDNVDDIDLSKFDINVEYKYNGEYSPSLLLKRIKENDNNR